MERKLNKMLEVRRGTKSSFKNGDGATLNHILNEGRRLHQMLTVGEKAKSYFKSGKEATSDVNSWEGAKSFFKEGRS